MGYHDKNDFTSLLEGKEYPTVLKKLIDENNIDMKTVLTLKKVKVLVLDMYYRMIEWNRSIEIDQIEKTKTGKEIIEYCRKKNNTKKDLIWEVRNVIIDKVIMESVLEYYKRLMVSVEGRGRKDITETISKAPVEYKKEEMKELE